MPRRSHVPPPAGAGPRILLARPDHLGDVLLSLPAAAAIRAAYPDALIGYAVPAKVATAPMHCAEIDYVHGLPFPGLHAEWRPGSLDSAAAAVRGRYDAAVLPRPDDPWSGALCATAGIPVRTGFAMPRTRPFLSHPLPVPVGRHVADMALDVAAAALTSLHGTRVTLRRAAAQFVPTPADEAAAAAVLADLGPPDVVMHPGSGWRLKNWPVDRWATLAVRLREARGHVVLVLGAPAEQPLVEAVVATSGGAAVRLAEPLPLGALAAVHARARLVVGTDSGALQLAAVVGTPTVGIYGPADPAMFAPPGDRHRVVRAALPCSPCGTLERPPCGAVRNPACVTGVSVAAVLAAVLDGLDPTR